MQEECIEKKLKELKESVVNKQEFNENAFREMYKELKHLQNEFLSLLKRAYEYSGNKSLERMLIALENEDVSHLIDSLAYTGRTLNESLRKDLERLAYKLLELIRMGKRSDVMYIITRMYIANNEKIPSVLLEAFKPIYDDETFKTLMYTFIGSAIKTEKEGGKANE